MKVIQFKTIDLKTSIEFKSLLTIVISFSFLISACSSEFAFQEVLSSCEPPPSSARNGTNKGPIITSPEAFSPYNSSATISGTCEDGFPLEIRGSGIDGSLSLNCVGGRFSSNITFKSGDGAKEIDVSQPTAALGLEVRDRRCFTLDTIPPKVVISGSTGALSSNQSTVRIEGICESGLDVSINGPQLVSSTTTNCRAGIFSTLVTFTGNDGLKDVVAIQVDRAGNRGNDDQQYLTDLTPPNVTIDSPAPMFLSQGNVTISGRCETGPRVNIQGQISTGVFSTDCLNGTYTANIDLTNGDGVKNVVVTQTDIAGNSSSVNRDFMKDSTPPLVLFTSPAPNTQSLTGLTLTGSCENNLPVVLSGSGIKSNQTTSCSANLFSINILFSDDSGPKEIVATQTDKSGNRGSDSRAFIRGIPDVTPPHITIDSPAANTFHNENVNLSGSCEAGLIVSITGDVASTQTTTCPSGLFNTQVSFSANNGIKNVVVSQTDAFGNTGTDNRNFMRANNAGFESFTSKGAGGKVDILFVDDNSVSMDPEQAALGDKFASFTSALSTADWQVGIITTDCSNGSPFNFCGQLFDFVGLANEYILKPTSAGYLNAFKNTIRRPETLSCQNTGFCPSGTEEGLKSTIQAFNLRNTTNAGFFRDGADLAIVYLSDEDERSNAPLAATTPTDVVNAFNSTWGRTKRLSTYGIIIQPGDSACFNAQKNQSGGQANYGTYFDQLAIMTSGLTVSICAADYSLTLKKIGDNVTRLSSAIDLAHTPINGTVNVTFTPAHSTAFTVTGNRVIFNTPAPLGTLVEVNYEY